MFGHTLYTLAFIVMFCAAAFALPSIADAWRGYSYYDVSQSTYGYATAWGSAYPGAPYYPGYGPPYYPGYGPPYYQGFGPPYVSRSGYSPVIYGYPRPNYGRPAVMYWR